MGLDSYLSAEISFYGIDKDEKKVLAAKMDKVRNIFPEMFKCGNLDYVRISFEAGYWRKTNHIHAWFVKNVQDGKDDCGRYEVSRDDLEKLLRICKEVISQTRMKNGKVRNGYIFDSGIKIPMRAGGKVVVNPSIAHSLLPTQEGFFFGSTDYDQYYIDDIKNTITIIERCLMLPKEWSFHYQSSW